MVKTKADIIKILKNGGVGVIPTDTIYGLVGSVFSREVVDRIYQIKERDEKKPLIVLISCLKDLEEFGVIVDKEMFKFLEKFWPGKVSIILPFSNSRFTYLNKEGQTLAFRFPNDERLLSILKQTGPLVAPSANPEGLESASNIEMANEYFGREVDFYLDGGELESLPSTLLEIEYGTIKILREGENIEKILARLEEKK
ncbi:MAG: L-threonylcarbamoyladenylate synthase [Patescibacteria group bacterium]|nr:L-threonylcarbamoyladenylate synthase [Patescibacteria group bacterium]